MAGGEVVLRIALLLGRQPNQVALACRLAARFEIAGTVLSENVPRRGWKNPVRRFANRVAGRIVGRPLVRAWDALQDRYRAAFPSPPKGPVLDVRNVNDPAVVDALRGWKPDLVAVSGTNLVGRSVLAQAEKGRGVVNLHTGLSPYVNGGPNCTNWCLAEGRFHLIGSTVLRLDPGIDSGPIIATERTPLEGGESLADLQWKVMEHAHDLYVRALLPLLGGGDLPSVKQDSVAPGRTYYTVEWGAAEMRRALRNHRERFTARELAGGEFRRLAESVRVFPAPKADGRS